MNNGHTQWTLYEILVHLKIWAEVIYGYSTCVANQIFQPLVCNTHKWRLDQYVYSYSYQFHKYTLINVNQ